MVSLDSAAGTTTKTGDVLVAGSGKSARKRREPEPEIVRFSNNTAPIVPGFTICNLSLQDVEQLNMGRVPGWVIETTDLFLKPWRKELK